MTNQKIESQYFINKLSDKELKLFNTDPKQFRVLYCKKLTNLVKQDLQHMVDIVTPVYEVVHYSDWYDSWHEEFFWYNISKEHQPEATNLFRIYCPKGTAIMSLNDMSKLDVKDKDFFNLLRAVYYYKNYTNRKMWSMPHIRTLNPSGHDIRPRIADEDFVKEDYNYKRKTTKLKILKTKKELEQILQEGSKKIADELINKEITRIKNINAKIQEAKATIAQYGTELVRGY